MKDSPIPHHDTAPCAAFRASFDDLVADEADALTVARADAHATECAPCRFALAAARAYRRTMRRVGDAVRAPDALRAHAFKLSHEGRDGD